jgi:hypothetical protein
MVVAGTSPEMREVNNNGWKKEILFLLILDSMNELMRNRRLRERTTKYDAI